MNRVNFIFNNIKMNLVTVKIIKDSNPIFLNCEYEGKNKDNNIISINLTILKSEFEKALYGEVQK